MTNLDPIIAVDNVKASAELYHRIFGFINAHGGENFAVLTTENGDIILCHHKWSEHEHPSLTDKTLPTGNGLVLYFRTNDLETIRKKVGEVGIPIEVEIHLNPNSLKKKFSFKDLDGYYLTVTKFHKYEG